jgi:hypothetical protein
VFKARLLETLEVGVLRVTDPVISTIVRIAGTLPRLKSLILNWDGRSEGGADAASPSALPANSFPSLHHLALKSMSSRDVLRYLPVFSGIQLTECTSISP